VYNEVDALRSSRTTRVIVSLLLGFLSLTTNDCEQYGLLQQTHLTAPPCRVGDSAKNAYHSNPENTVFDAKRLIGRRTDEADVKRDMKHWPFQIVDKGGKPSISVKYRGEKRDFVSRP
jgi:hypothetical protein